MFRFLVSHPVSSLIACCLKQEGLAELYSYSSTSQFLSMPA